MPKARRRPTAVPPPAVSKKHFTYAEDPDPEPKAVSTSVPTEVSEPKKAKK